MARKDQQDIALSVLRRSTQPLTRDDIQQRTGSEVPGRTLRRWLSEWVAEGALERSGVGRATRYRYLGRQGDVGSSVPEPMGFLRGLDDDLRRELLAQIRDLWTHTSTALEGNTLTLGDTHFILQEGLTISGKPIAEHQEVIGHARAIDLLYQCLDEPLSEHIIFELHNAVQTDRTTDIYKPNGAWKVEPNGTHMVTTDGRQVFIEYAMPEHVPALMAEIIEFVNAIDGDELTTRVAHESYSKIHMGVAHVHPFWDGNGRIARLLANVPLLKSGLPPLTIPTEVRRDYIQLLANYQIEIGQLNANSGVWPDEPGLVEFSQFCSSCYGGVRELVEAAYDVQRRR